MSLNGTSDGLTIDQMSIGVSSAGVEKYLENLKTDCFDKAIADLEKTSAIQSQLDAGWQGNAKIVFTEQMNESIQQLKEALESEYSSLEVQIRNIMNDYYTIDNSLMGE